MKKDDDAQALEKLMKLTKLMKAENIKVAPKGPPKGANKWRAQDPKFAAPKEKPAEMIEAGGMQVDPSRKEEYDNWRKDKLEEQKQRMEARARKAEAARAARKAAEASKPSDPA